VIAAHPARRAKVPPVSPTHLDCATMIAILDGKYLARSDCSNSAYWGRMPGLTRPIGPARNKRNDMALPECFASQRARSGATLAKIAQRG